MRATYLVIDPVALLTVKGKQGHYQGGYKVYSFPG